MVMRVRVACCVLWAGMQAGVAWTMRVRVACRVLWAGMQAGAAWSCAFAWHAAFSGRACRLAWHGHASRQSMPGDRLVPKQPMIHEGERDAQSFGRFGHFAVLFRARGRDHPRNSDRSSQFDAVRERKKGVRR